VYFRRVLREGWRGWEKQAQFACRFYNGFQTTEREWVRYHRFACALGCGPNVEHLVKSDLGSHVWSEFMSAACTLEFLGSFQLAGHGAELIQNTHETSPDARLKIQNRWVTVEFKAMNPSEDQRAWSDFEAEVFALLMSEGLEVDSFDIDFSPVALGAAASVVEGLVAISQSRSTDFLPLPNGAGRAKYVKGTGKLPGFTIPLNVRSDQGRLLDKLSSAWWQQLAQVEGPTLLVVRARSLFPLDSLDDTSKMAANLATALRERLRGRRMVSGVLLYDEPFWPAHEPIHHAEEAFRLTIGPSPSGTLRITLLVTNPEPRVHLLAEEMGSLVGPQMIW
jgi:hypothetical protein